MKRTIPDAPDEPAESFGRDYFAHAYGGSRGSYGKRATPNKWRSMCGFIKAHVPDFTHALDIGCAEGAFLAHAVGYFPKGRWSGTDVSGYALERARAVAPGLDLRQGSALHLPFDNDTFDLVTAFDVLEHLEKLEQALEQIARVLQSGGYLIATVPVYDGPIGWLVRTLDRDPTHVHKVGRDWWLSESLCQRFELIAWEGAWRYYLGRYWHARAALGRQFAPAVVMAWRLKSSVKV